MRRKQQHQQQKNQQQKKLEDDERIKREILKIETRLKNIHEVMLLIIRDSTYVILVINQLSLYLSAYLIYHLSRR